MKVVGLKQANWSECIQEAQRERIVITRGGKPVALLVGVEGMDLEQISLGYSDRFWQLITARRKEKPISRAELERRLRESDESANARRLSKKKKSRDGKEVARNAPRNRDRIQ